MQGDGYQPLGTNDEQLEVRKKQKKAEKDKTIMDLMVEDHDKLKRKVKNLKKKVKKLERKNRNLERYGNYKNSYPA
ncbi:hypothetical protein CL621_01470 [archaeon]|nr:hypothetical protein [archaeon]|tara:strand:+ start:1466 stop:1693 length:228 start_codon:yes stop_codon:yes gene_type:complete